MNYYANSNNIAHLTAASYPTANQMQPHQHHHHTNYCLSNLKNAQQQNLGEYAKFQQVQQNLNLPLTSATKNANVKSFSTESNNIYSKFNYYDNNYNLKEIAVNTQAGLIDPSKVTAAIPLKRKTSKRSSKKKSMFSSINSFKFNQWKILKPIDIKRNVCLTTRGLL
jgi:hypothetical protein